MSLPNNYVCEGQMTIFDILSPDGWYGKTCREPLVREPQRAVTSDASLKKPQKSQIKTPLFLDLRGGRWTPSGCIMGNGWSIAWRVHDAQFWGVPQRRKRIALVADFGGLTAPEILFERQSVSGDSEESREKGQGVAADPEGCVNPSSYVFGINGNIAGTIDASYYKGCGERQGIEREVICIGNGQADISSHITKEKAQTLNCMHDQQAILAYGVDCYNMTETGNKTMSITGAATDAHHIPCVTTQETIGALCARDYKGVGNQFIDDGKIIVDKIPSATVRRLTPLECERLQGFPDFWTSIGEWTDSKGKKHKDSDSPRYKALGNSIALPFWEWMAKRMISQLDSDNPTMASLFDGIGGFPLVYSRAGCKPIWASEIEKFPIAVTKLRFPN